MKKEDMTDLWNLLAVYRKGDVHLKDSTLKAAWFLVLKPFSRDEVREAVGAYFRQRSYWPDPTEIAMLCPKPDCATPTYAIDADLVEWWRKRKAKRVELGLPDYETARKQGMDWNAYCTLLEESGL